MSQSNLPKDLNLPNPNHEIDTSLTISVKTHYGADLELSHVSRFDSGVYLCLANNGVPPTVSKRVRLYVDCKSSYCRGGSIRLLGSGIQIFAAIWEPSCWMRIFWSMVRISKKIQIPFRIWIPFGI